MLAIRRKPLAAIAATAAATAALAVPAANASAAPKERQFGTPPYFLCLTLAQDTQAALLTGNVFLASALGATLQDIGCGGAAI